VCDQKEHYEGEVNQRGIIPICAARMHDSILTQAWKRGWIIWLHRESRRDRFTDGILQWCQLFRR